MAHSRLVVLQHRGLDFVGHGRPSPIGWKPLPYELWLRIVSLSCKTYAYRVQHKLKCLMHDVVQYDDLMVRLHIDDLLTKQKLRRVSKSFQRIVLEVEQRDRCRIVIPVHRTVTRVEEEKCNYLSRCIVLVAFVEPDLKLSDDEVLARAVEGKDDVKHIHIHGKARTSTLQEISEFWQHVLAILHANDDKLQSVSLNPCHHVLFPDVRLVSSLKVLELTFDERFSVMEFASKYVKGTWVTLELLVVRLSGFHPLRSVIVDVIFGDEYPVLRSFYLYGFAPNDCIHRFLLSCPSIAQLSIITPKEEFPFEPTYQFVLPSMPSLEELAVTERHIPHYCARTQSTLSIIVLYDENWPVHPFSADHHKIVSKLLSSVVFPSLRTVMFRSVLNSEIERIFHPLRVTHQ
ncbi:hypothetical protein SCHPADRAFT_947072 [Schizopora paradoxa]|uniref:Uncharacterized protein n=1 Tax=Schizopora paradoxa TaxID=27342 RepID=A0A0H2R0J9_9AGAM|nr:hypothetical protein SCHPADRAFT_947072 [Schizopora paradoxa]